MNIYCKISEVESGEELKNILRRRLNLSGTMVKRLKYANAIYVNGRAVFTNFRVSAGDEVVLDIDSAEPESGVIPEIGDIDIIFENDWYLALNKPSGQIVHPSRARYTGTLMNYAAGYLGGACHSVNRLDRDTGGVVLLAKNAAAKYRAIESMKNTGTLKEYIAVIMGEMPEDSGCIDVAIKRREPGSMMRITAPDGDRAVTYYEVLGESEMLGEKLSLIRLKLATGRTHQIRVHCLYLGCPLLGDNIYSTEGSRHLSKMAGIEGCLLHANHMKLKDPFGDGDIDLRAPVRRKDFLGLLGKFRENPIDSL